MEKMIGKIEFLCDIYQYQKLSSTQIDRAIEKGDDLDSLRDQDTRYKKWVLSLGVEPILIWSIKIVLDISIILW